MALNGFVSKEDRATRLVKTARGFVAVVRRAPQDYQVIKDGRTLGRVVKFKHWYPELSGDKCFMGPMGNGSRWPQTTRREAIEWVVRHAKNIVGP